MTLSDTQRSQTIPLRSQTLTELHSIDLSIPLYLQRTRQQYKGRWWIWDSREQGIWRVVRSSWWRCSQEVQRTY